MNVIIQQRIVPNWAGPRCGMLLSHPQILPPIWPSRLPTAIPVDHTDIPTLIFLHKSHDCQKNMCKLIVHRLYGNQSFLFPGRAWSARHIGAKLKGSELGLRADCKCTHDYRTEYLLHTMGKKINFCSWGFLQKLYRKGQHTKGRNCSRAWFLWSSPFLR